MIVTLGGGGDSTSLHQIWTTGGQQADRLHHTQGQGSRPGKSMSGFDSSHPRTVDHLHR
jgi:hypothetical protein